MKYMRASILVIILALLLVIFIPCAFAANAEVMTQAAEQTESYKIVVDISDRLVTVYGSAGKEHDKLDGEYLKLVKEMPIVMDVRLGDATVGSYTAEGPVGENARVRFLRVNCWVRYVYYIEDNLMIHSEPSLRPDGNPSEAAKEKFNGHQKICLSVEDAQWLVENVPAGATVVIQE